MTFTETSDLNGDNPQFTLTCNSTGITTNVTWIRDNNVSITEGAKSTIDNHLTVLRSHTQLVHGRVEGLYRCIIKGLHNQIVNSSLEVKGKNYCNFIACIKIFILCF